MTTAAGRRHPKHRISRSELTALATGEIAAAEVSRLVAAESSKHRLLVEAVRRAAVGRPLAWGTTVDEAFRLLAEVEDDAPGVVARMLALPQVGGWAVQSLRQIERADAEGTDTGDRSQAQPDLGYLANLAATAALVSGRPFELQVLIRHGQLLLPGIGIRFLGPSADRAGSARIRLDRDGAYAICGQSVISLPNGRETDMWSTATRLGWQPIPRFRVESDGLVLDVLLDGVDPYLCWVSDHIDPRSTWSASRQAAWRLRLGAAWRLLVDQHRAAAQAMAATITTIVPLTGTQSPRPRSASSGWTFGAIGMSLPHDELAFAETLVHELQHVLLGVVEDLIPLVHPDRDGGLNYAPWRDDPRPADGLLHGSYAYLGVTAFWRRQYLASQPDGRLRAAASYARWRAATLEASRALARSAALTTRGRSFVTAICETLAGWQAEPVPAEAERIAADARIEHRVRWRLNFVRISEAQVDALARDWLDRAPVPEARIRPVTVLRSSEPVLGPARGWLMERRYQNPTYIAALLACRQPPGDLPDPMGALTEADLALLRGDWKVALGGFGQRLTTGGDPDIWTGYAVAAHHAGEPAAAWLLTEWPELVVTVHARIRTLRGTAPDAAELAAWLSLRVTPGSDGDRPAQ